MRKIIMASVCVVIIAQIYIATKKTTIGVNNVAMCSVVAHYLEFSHIKNGLTYFVLDDSINIADVIADYETSVYNVENEEFVNEVAFNLGIKSEDVTQNQYDARYK